MREGDKRLPHDPAARFRDEGLMLRERIEHLMQILPEDSLQVNGTKIIFEDHLLIILSFFYFCFRLIFSQFSLHEHIHTNTHCFKFDTITGNLIVMIDGLKFSLSLKRKGKWGDSSPLTIIAKREIISEETILPFSTSSHKICFLLQIFISLSAHADPFPFLNAFIPNHETIIHH